MYRMSPDWRIMYEVNSATLASTSGPLEDWLHRYIPDEDHPAVFAATEKATATKGILELEHRVRVANGDVRWVLSRAAPLMTPSGDISEWFGASTDVTDRKRAERALRERRALAKRR
ncbi:PAS domain-containing protein [Pseudoroseomonas wenyumeiae]